MKAKYLSVALIATLLVSACSGGGGDTAPNPPPPAPDLSGVAAVGHPIVGGTIDIRCATGNLLSTTTNSTGGWEMALAGRTMPCAVQVRNGTINGISNTRPYHSIAVATGTVNVTPFTDLLMANLAGTASPETWFTGLSTATTPLATITQTEVDTSLANLRTALGGSLPQLASIDPITTAFAPVPGDTSDDMLSALATAMQTSAVPYTDLLTDASAPTFTAPATAFTTALTTASEDTVSAVSARTAALAGTWYRQRLQAGRTTTDMATGTIIGTTFNWNRGPETVDASGNVTPGTESASNGGGVVPTPFVRSIAADGTVTEADLVSYHGTMSKDKNFIVGTATAGNGLDPRLIITMKQDPAITFTMNDLAGTWHQHMIRAGRTTVDTATGLPVSTTSIWERGVETWDASGNMNGLSGARSDAIAYTPWADSGQLISSSGIITSAAVPTLYGVMSTSKDLVVTSKTAGNGIDVVMSIFQKQDPAVTFSMADLAGTWDKHTIRVGMTTADTVTGAPVSTTSRWEHSVLTWDEFGNMGEISGAWSDAGAYVLSLGGSGLTISTQGVVTDTNVPTFQGVMSASKDLVVGTRTAVSNGDVILVIFQKR